MTLTQELLWRERNRISYFCVIYLQKFSNKQRESCLRKFQIQKKQNYKINYVDKSFRKQKRMQFAQPLDLLRI